MGIGQLLFMFWARELHAFTAEHQAFFFIATDPQFAAPLGFALLDATLFLRSTAQASFAQ